MVSSDTMSTPCSFAVRHGTGWKGQKLGSKQSKANDNNEKDIYRSLRGGNKSRCHQHAGGKYRTARRQDSRYLRRRRTAWSRGRQHSLPSQPVGAGLVIPVVAYTDAERWQYPGQGYCHRSACPVSAVVPTLLGTPVNTWRKCPCPVLPRTGACPRDGKGLSS